MTGSLKRPLFLRFESLLGLGLVAAVVLFVVPPLQTGMENERPLRTLMEAETVAHAVLDYHTDTGRWPLKGDGRTDLALLVPAHNRARTRAMANTMNSATEGFMMGTMISQDSAETEPSEDQASWLEEVPVDPWDRPFRVVVMGDRTGSGALDSSSGYPNEPPTGTAIVVLSAGANGLFDTDLAKLWSADLSGRLASEGSSDQPRTDNSFGGDDLGFILSRSTLGGR